MEGWDWRWFWDWTTNILSSIIEPKYHSIMRWAKMAWRSLLLPNTILLNIIITFSPIVIQRKKKTKIEGQPLLHKASCLLKMATKSETKFLLKLLRYHFYSLKSGSLLSSHLSNRLWAFPTWRKKNPKLTFLSYHNYIHF